MNHDDKTINVGTNQIPDLLENEEMLNQRAIDKEDEVLNELRRFKESQQARDANRQ